MKTRKTFIAAAIVAVLSCSAAHAQVLGGSVGGAANGALGGGIGNSSVFGGGNAAGSFGGELDTGSMIHRTRGVADQTSQRARNVGTNVRNRTESTVATAHDKSASVATSAAAATQAAKDQQMRNTTNVAGATEVIFTVEDVRAATDALKQQGITFSHEPHQVNGPMWAANFPDPDGHLLTLFGPERRAG